MTWIQFAIARQRHIDGLPVDPEYGSERYKPAPPTRFPRARVEVAPGISPWCRVEGARMQCNHRMCRES